MLFCYVAAGLVFYKTSLRWGSNCGWVGQELKQTSRPQCYCTDATQRPGPHPHQTKSIRAL